MRTIWPTRNRMYSLYVSHTTFMWKLSKVFVCGDNYCKGTEKSNSNNNQNQKQTMRIGCVCLELIVCCSVSLFLWTAYDCDMCMRFALVRSFFPSCNIKANLLVHSFVCLTERINQNKIKTNLNIVAVAVVVVVLSRNTFVFASFHMPI